MKISHHEFHQLLGLKTIGRIKIILLAIVYKRALPQFVGVTYALTRMYVSKLHSYNKGIPYHKIDLIAYDGNEKSYLTIQLTNNKTITLTSIYSGLTVSE